MAKLEVNENEPLFEWKIRRIPEPAKEPVDNYNQRLRDWALSSIGIEGTAKQVFLLITGLKMASLDEVAKRIQKSCEETREFLDLLYSTGLVDNVGTAYYVKETLASLIVTRLIPRVTESLRSIARVESKARVNADYYRRMTGRSFSSVAEAIVTCKEINRAGGTPIARVVGVQSANGEAIEVEGVVIDLGLSGTQLMIIGQSGEKVVVGEKGDRGSDVNAHSILVRGERK
jgi:hypothetical protein